MFSSSRRIRPRATPIFSKILALNEDAKRTAREPPDYWLINVSSQVNNATKKCVGPKNSPSSWRRLFLAERWLKQVDKRRAFLAITVLASTCSFKVLRDVLNVCFSYATVIDNRKFICKQIMVSRKIDFGVDANRLLKQSNVSSKHTAVRTLLKAFILLFLLFVKFQ